MLDESHIAPIQYSLTDEVVSRLTQAIMNGQFGPGERLNEEKIARGLEVSRGLVRDAVRQLERQGLIVTRRNHGSFVARLTREDVEEVYSMRQALEALAIERAIQFAQPCHFEAMQAIIEQMAMTNSQKMTAQQAAELDLQFHDLIYAASNHRRLNESWMNLRPQIQIVFLTRNAANANFREQNPIVHQELLDALRQRNTAKARELSTHYIHLSYQHALEMYPP